MHIPPRILEAGCGEGKDVLQFLTGRGYELWAADILERALPWEDVSFVRADAAELPFADGEFDLVITVGLLEHIEPHRTALRSRLVPPPSPGGKPGLLLTRRLALSPGTARLPGLVRNTVIYDPPGRS